MKKMLLGIILIVSMLIADQRHFVWTYEYKTVSQGEVEFEHYYTTSYPNSSDLSENLKINHQFEIEVGMNDRFDFAFYHQFEEFQSNFKYKGYKLRWRYRIGEKNKYLFDPILYFEYHGKPDFSEHKIESKIILAKETNKIIVSLNPIIEFEMEDNEKEMEMEYSAGILYKINKKLNMGIEFKGSEYGNYCGPVISHGINDIWVSLGSAIAMNQVKENKPEIEIRMIMGVGIK